MTKSLAFATDESLVPAWARVLGIEVSSLETSPLPRGEDTHLVEVTVLILDEANIDLEKLPADSLGAWTLFPNEGNNVEATLYHGWLDDEPGNELVLIALSDADEHAAESAFAILATNLSRSRAAIVSEVAESQDVQDELVWLDVITTGNAELLDRIVNYTNVDDRVFDLTDLIERRLSEAQLKTSRQISQFIPDHDVGRHDGWTDDEGHPLLVPHDTEEQSLWPDARSRLTELEGLIGEAYEKISTLLETSLSLARSLNEMGTRKSDRAMNAVLYWLGIITMFFGFVAVYDKYQSSETAGIGWQEGLTTSFLLIFPLFAFFFFTMLKNGLVSRRLTAWFRRVVLRLLEMFVFSWFGNVLLVVPGIRRLKSSWIGQWWMLWIEWKRTLLLEGPLVYLSEEDINRDDDDFEESFERLEDNEEWALDLFGSLWEDLDVKSDTLLSDNQPRRIAGLVKKLRAEVVVNSALSFLCLELPRPCPLPIYATLLLKLPVMVGTQAWFAGTLTRSNVGHRTYMGTYAWLYGSGESGHSMWRAFRDATLGLLRAHRPDEDDATIWRVFQEQVLEPGTSELEGWLQDALFELDFDDIQEAYEPLLRSRCLEAGAHKKA